MEPRQLSLSLVTIHTPTGSRSSLSTTSDPVALAWSLLNWSRRVEVRAVDGSRFVTLGAR